MSELLKETTIDAIREIKMIEASPIRDKSDVLDDTPDCKDGFTKQRSIENEHK